MKKTRAKTFTMALMTAGMLGFAPGVAVSGEGADPLAEWTKLDRGELDGAKARGIGIYGDENVVAEDSYNFTQTNDPDTNQENENSPFVNSAAAGADARVGTGRIYGDYIVGNRGLVITSKVSGILNNVSTLVMFNIYYEQQ